MNKSKFSLWPELSFNQNKDTYHTIHLWTQIIGKIKLAAMPWINHSWHVTLLVVPSGLTTSDLFLQGRHFQISLNFLKHHLEIKTSENEEKAFSLLSLSVAGFYSRIMMALKELGIEIRINTTPNEMENPFTLDKEEHDSYNPETAKALHYSFLMANEVFTVFRTGFTGKSSQVHFFWGSFDLALSRFSGRTAPVHPGGIPNLPDWVVREAYSHEVFSCGFWPGNDALPLAAFYSYIYPEPDGFNTVSIKPEEAYYHPDLREYILPYEVVRQAQNPSQILLEFLDSTYAAAADLAKWKRKKLDYKNSKIKG